VVIIEFPDIASIKNWYRAPEYQPSSRCAEAPLLT
jgi:uncharacterized protein (DUF1330 family)